MSRCRAVMISVRERKRGELGGERRGEKCRDGGREGGKEGATLRALHLKLALFQTLVYVVCVFGDRPPQHFGLLSGIKHPNMWSISPPANLSFMNSLYRFPQRQLLLVLCILLFL